jgi:ribosomal protein L17
MKHGTRIWEKKLGRSPSHRKSLLINLLTELVKHEQIETTVAKAQFLKHEMEKMINVAKGGTKRDWNWVQQNLNVISFYLVQGDHSPKVDAHHCKSISRP